jgi:GntR family transcriptional regulator
VAPAGVARRLGIAVGAEVAFLERVMFLDDRPLTLRSSWIPASLARPILNGEVDLRRSIYELLECGLGLHLGATDYSIEATLADESVASIMSVAIGSPMLLLEGLTRLDDMRPAEYGHARCPGDRVRYVTSVRHHGDRRGSGVVTPQQQPPTRYVNPRETVAT